MKNPAMNRILEKTSFITEDGTSYDTLQKAQAHNRMVDLLNYLDDHPIEADGYSFNGMIINSWLRANPRLVLTLLPPEPVSVYVEDVAGGD